MNSMSEADDTRRKRLLWRATHRGIKEMDLILGGFVARHLDRFDAAELDELEAIMQIPDQEMLAWATKQSDIPAARATPLLLRILDHKP
jgi:antitoxin CptB